MGVARRFFIVLRGDLLDAIMLAIGRLLDPAIEGRFYNASLEQLVEYIERLDQSDYDGLTDRLRRILNDIRSNSTRILKWRNKWGAHRDLEYVQSEVMPATRLAEIEEFILLAGHFLNEFERVFQDLPVEFNLNEKTESEIMEFGERQFNKIYPPGSYQNMAFEDDGITILDLIRKANAH
jgi:hypothetical protein